jgi:hypothetical protein
MAREISSKSSPSFRNCEPFFSSRIWPCESARPRNFGGVLVASNIYIDRVRLVVEHMHDCSAVHAGRVFVRDEFNGQVAWEGDVEIFDLINHPKAKRALLVGVLSKSIPQYRLPGGRMNPFQPFC